MFRRVFTLACSPSAGIYIFAPHCSAHYQPIQGPGGMMKQIGAQTQLWSTWAWNWNVSYHRIRITNRDDIESVYPPIATYVERPSLAQSVKEAPLDADQWPSPRTCCLGKDGIG